MAEKVADKIRKARNSRNGYKTQVKKALGELNDLKPEDDNLSEVQLRSIQARLTTYLGNLKGLDSSILELLDDGEAESAECNEAIQFSETIMVGISKVDLLLSRLAGPQTPGTTSDGQSETAQEFWDMFETAVDGREDLKQVDKLNYLLSFLKGEAHELVKGYRLVASNYDVVVKVLKERYGDKQTAIHAHMDKLLSVSADPKDPRALQTIYTECERHIRCLVALGLGEENFGQVFTPIILRKLPEDVCVLFHRQKGPDPWELTKLRELMREEIRNRESSSRYVCPSKQVSTDGCSQHNKTFNRGMAKGSPGFKPTGAMAKPSKSPHCQLCAENHYPDQCKRYAMWEERRAQLHDRCYKCLADNHQQKNCSSRRTCFYCKSAKHHSCLCRDKFSADESSGQRPSGAQGEQKPQAGRAPQRVNCTTLSQCNRRVQMRMASVNFKDKHVVLQIFFDNGSSFSYIRTRACKVLGLHPEVEETIWSAKFGDTDWQQERHGCVIVDIPTMDGEAIPVTAFVTEHICCPMAKYPIDTSKNPILTQVKLADTTGTQMAEVGIDILIGEDHYDDFILPERVQLGNGMKLTASRLGYILSGLVVGAGDVTRGAVAVKMHQQCTPPIQQLWDLENIGIKADPYCNDDDKALEQFKSSIRLDDVGRYEVKFPWKVSEPQLPDNFGLALGCLQSLLKRIGNNKDILASYDDTIRDQLAKGVIEVAPRECTPGKTHYIPHHCIVKDDRATTKLRIVYNASARRGKQDQSLNECLLRGPVLLENLIGILLRFREHEVGISCDVEKAFLQVGLQRSERDVTRFLWVMDTSKPPTTENIIVYRFCRVLFGFVCSPFLLAATVQHHLTLQNTPTANLINRSMYVDNVINGVANPSVAIQYHDETKRLFADIQMNIREWYTNSNEFRRQISNIDLGKETKPKILGLRWDTAADTLTCQGFKNFCTDKVTKRSFLKSISTMFDPCGFLAPVTIRAKFVIQDLWKEKVPWDQEVSKKYLETINEIIRDCLCFQEVALPRLLQSSSSPEITRELHCFCDASGKAFASAIYLRNIYPGGKVGINLLLAKARLAPIRQISLPRLELLGLVLGARLTAFALSELDIPIADTTLWTDSTCALSWLASDKPLTVFVENQLREIKSHPGYSFRYVPSELNPADLPTRGRSIKQLRDCSLWWHGPEFLTMSKHLWPEETFAKPECVASEERKTVKSAKPITVPLGISNIFDSQRFSSLVRLLRATVFVLRFAKILNSRGQITAEDMSTSLDFWVKDVQLRIPKDYKRDKTLGVFSDETGILRYKGRLENSSLPTISLAPILLPRDFTSRS